MLLGQGPIDVGLPTCEIDSIFHADDEIISKFVDTSQVYSGGYIDVLCQRRSRRSDLQKPKSVVNVHALISKGFRLMKSGDSATSRMRHSRVTRFNLRSKMTQLTHASFPVLQFLQPTPPLPTHPLLTPYSLTPYHSKKLHISNSDLSL